MLPQPFGMPNALIHSSSYSQWSQALLHGMVNKATNLVPCSKLFPPSWPDQAWHCFGTYAWARPSLLLFRNICMGKTKLGIASEHMHGPDHAWYCFGTYAWARPSLVLLRNICMGQTKLGIVSEHMHGPDQAWYCFGSYAWARPSLLLFRNIYMGQTKLGIVSEHTHGPEQAIFSKSSRTYIFLLFRRNSKSQRIKVLLKIKFYSIPKLFLNCSDFDSKFSWRWYTYKLACTC